MVERQASVAGRTCECEELSANLRTICARVTAPSFVFNTLYLRYSNRETLLKNGTYRCEVEDESPFSKREEGELHKERSESHQGDHQTRIPAKKNGLLL